MKDGKGWHQEVANYVSIHHYWGEDGGVILSLSRISYCYLVGISYFYIIVTKLISRDMGNQSMKVWKSSLSHMFLFLSFPLSVIGRFFSTPPCVLSQFWKTTLSQHWFSTSINIFWPSQFFLAALHLAVLIESLSAHPIWVQTSNNKIQTMMCALGNKTKSNSKWWIKVIQLNRIWHILAALKKSTSSKPF